MGKRSTAPSKASSAVSGVTSSGHKSSVLLAAFSHSEFQLALFSSVIQGLEAQHVQIYDTNTGRLVCEHALKPQETVTSLDWGYYAGRPSGGELLPTKKRKRGSNVTAELEKGDIVVGFGTSSSDIRMYSPFEDCIVGALLHGHENGIKDFKFTADRLGREGWSIGGDNKLVQWDLRTGKQIRTIDLPTSSTFATLSRPVPTNPPLICASSTPYIVDVESTDRPSKSFTAMNDSIRIIITSGSNIGEGLFLTSDNGRYITVHDPLSEKATSLVMNLVTEKEVSSLSLYPDSTKPGGEEPVSLDKQVLAAITDDGTIELFTRPFVQSKDSLSSGSKAKKQNMRKADASVQVVRSESSDALVPLVMAAFQGDDLVIAWAEGGVVPVFERIKWLNRDTDELAFTGVKKFVRSKTRSMLGSATIHGTSKAGETYVDESKAVIEQGNIAEDVEMQDVPGNDGNPEQGSEVDDSDEDDEQTHTSERSNTKAQKSRNEPTEGTVKDVDTFRAPASSSPSHLGHAGQADEDGGEESGEPSFGDLLRAKDAEEVDVEAEVEDEVHLGLVTPGKPKAAAYQIPSGVSLSTVLAQALKTNDRDMLESCFHTGDLSIVRSTIQRLDSSLAATLLQRLAERLASRPGRYGHLLVWIQWTCVAHGGALAGNSDLLNRMTTLFKVMDQRSSSLPSLLLLKGKLDMIDAQLGLRQSVRRAAEGAESDDEVNVIYVEGQEEDEDSDGEREKRINSGPAATTTPRTAKSIRVEEDESMVNGVDESENEEDEEGSEDDDDDDEEILDIEAEESVGSSDAEESLEENEDDKDEEEESLCSMVDFIADSEEDESDGDDEAVDQAPPSKRARTGKGKSTGRRSASCID